MSRRYLESSHVPVVFVVASAMLFVEHRDAVGLVHRIVYIRLFFRLVAARCGHRIDRRGTSVFDSGFDRLRLPCASLSAEGRRVAPNPHLRVSNAMPKPRLHRASLLMRHFYVCLLILLLHKIGERGVLRMRLPLGLRG